MQSAQESPEGRQEASSPGVVSPPAQLQQESWTPSPTSPGPQQDASLQAEGAWGAAQAPEQCYPVFYYDGAVGPLHDPLIEPEPPRTSSSECLSFVLGIAFAGVLLGLGLLVVHGPLATHDITPEDDATTRSLVATPHAVGRLGIPHRMAAPRVAGGGRKRAAQRSRIVVPVGGSARNEVVYRAPVLSPKTKTAATEARTHDPDEHKEIRTDYESCSRHLYTHCTLPKKEFFYNVDQQSCVSAAEDTVHVCNRGSNRFASLDICLASCVKGRQTSDRCYENTIFFPCSRQDVLYEPWYFDGKKCVAWSFPQGSCLSAGHRGVFRSWDECRRHCVLHPGPECDEAPPPAETCSPRQLRHPYFADMQSHGGARCVNTSRRTLESQRCLIGSNQFSSMSACRRACVRS
ncbi:uncharacterized protein LOC144099940 [Amblyomma americanum]